MRNPKRHNLQVQLTPALRDALKGAARRAVLTQAGFARAAIEHAIETDLFTKPRSPGAPRRAK